MAGLEKRLEMEECLVEVREKRLEYSFLVEAQVIESEDGLEEELGRLPDGEQAALEKLLLYTRVVLEISLSSKHEVLEKPLCCNSVVEPEKPLYDNPEAEQAKPPSNTHVAPAKQPCCNSAAELEKQLSNTHSAPAISPSNAHADAASPAKSPLEPAASPSPSP